MIHSDCLWVIMHASKNGKPHFAWYQRALVVGDFKPGLVPRSEYVVDEMGRCADTDYPPVCTTCKIVGPSVDELTAFERATGHGGFIEHFRSGHQPWTAPTNPLTCWHCNCAGPVVAGGMCQRCVDHLEDWAGRETKSKES